MSSFKEIKKVIKRALQEAEIDSMDITDTPALVCSRLLNYIYRAIEFVEDCKK